MLQPVCLGCAGAADQTSVVPLALLGKRTRMGKLLALAACFWGIAATCFAAVNTFAGAYACRFLVGLGGEHNVPTEADVVRGGLRSAHPGIFVAFLYSEASGFPGGHLVGDGSHGVSPA